MNSSLRKIYPSSNRNSIVRNNIVKNLIVLSFSGSKAIKDYFKRLDRNEYNLNLSFYRNLLS